jgi:hypothetical protein
MVATEARGELARYAIGLREVLFQSITHMVPGAAVVFRSSSAPTSSPATEPTAA